MNYHEATVSRAAEIEDHRPVSVTHYSSITKVEGK